VLGETPVFFTLLFIFFLKALAPFQNSPRLRTRNELTMLSAWNTLRHLCCRPKAIQVHRPVGHLKNHHIPVFLVWYLYWQATCHFEWCRPLNTHPLKF